MPHRWLRCSARSSRPSASSRHDAPSFGSLPTCSRSCATTRSSASFVHERRAARSASTSAADGPSRSAAWTGTAIVVVALPRSMV
jgi:hypothetical protein